MSKIEFNLEEENSTKTPNFGEYQEQARESTLGKVLKIFAGLTVVVLLVGAIGGFFYWRYLKTTPQYSLALLVEAARNDNQKAVDEIVNVDAVVDDFAPQIIDKAVDLYGRGIAPDVIKKALVVAQPVLPVIKQRAKAELPGLIRERTKKFEDIPFWAIAIGASQYLDIKLQGDKAIVKSKIKNRPLEVEMKRNGDKWQIVALKDEKLAQNIAGKIGQEILGLARNKNRNQIEQMGKDLGIDIKKIQDIFKK